MKHLANEAVTVYKNNSFDFNANSKISTIPIKSKSNFHVLQIMRRYIRKATTSANYGEKIIAPCTDYFIIIDQVGRVFANGLGDLGSIPGQRL